MLLHSVELLVDSVELLVDSVVHHHLTNHHHSHLVVVLVDSMLLHSVVQLVEQVIKPRPHKSNNMLPMLKVSSKILTHKSSVNQLLVVFKLIPKTSKFDSFNHHLSHPQAHSSSKKCDHLNHPHHHHSEFVNKPQLSQHPHHSFSVNDHHEHPLRLLRKLLFVVWVLYQSHHDQSSSNDFHPSHPNHVTSSSNDGSHTEVKLNEKPSFNVLLLPKLMLHHET